MTLRALVGSVGTEAAAPMMAMLSREKTGSVESFAKQFNSQAQQLHRLYHLVSKQAFPGFARVTFGSILQNLFDVRYA